MGTPEERQKRYCPLRVLRFLVNPGRFWLLLVFQSVNTMETKNNTNGVEEKWTEEVIAQGQCIRTPTLAISLPTILKHFQNIFGP